MSPDGNNDFVDKFPKNSTETVCVGISDFRGMRLVFVRLFAKQADGSPFATRYGVSLPVEKCSELVSAVRALSEMMTAEGEVARILKNEREQVRVGLNLFHGRTLVDLRTYAPIGPQGEYKPTKDGLSLNLDFLPLLLVAMEKLAMAVRNPSQGKLTSPDAPTHVSMAHVALEGVEVRQLAAEVAKDLYVDESGFLIHPYLMRADEPRKSRDERWGTAPLPTRAPGNHPSAKSKSVFQKIAAGVNRIRVGGGHLTRPAILPVPRQHGDFRAGLLKCPLCEHRTEYGVMYDHIVICHPSRNAKIVMAEFNRELRKDGGWRH